MLFGRPPGPLEIGLILLIIVIVFGVGKLPQVGGAIGKGIRSFRRAQSGEDEDEDEDKEEPRRRRTTAKKTATKKTKKTARK